MKNPQSLALERTAPTLLGVARPCGDGLLRLRSPWHHHALAALEAATGMVTEACTDRPRHQEVKRQDERPLPPSRAVTVLSPPCAPSLGPALAIAITLLVLEIFIPPGPSATC